MCICFGIVLFPKLFTFGSSLNVCSLWRVIAANGHCLLWHGWLPGLGLGGQRSPWAGSLGQLAVRSLEMVLGSYPVDSSCFWSLPDYWDAEVLAVEIGDYPCVWTDGSFDPLPLVDVSVAGAGVYLPAIELAMHGGGIWWC